VISKKSERRSPTRRGEKNAAFRAGSETGAPLRFTRIDIGDVFSLTPALSRWEREKRSLFFGKATMVNCLLAFAF
jgi:hypothetical protein